MAIADQAVIATSIPGLGYRVLEELEQVTGMRILGPIQAPAEVLEVAKHARSTIYICDDQMGGLMLRAWPGWDGWLVRLTSNDQPEQTTEGPLLATLSLQDDTWTDALRELLRAEYALATVSTIMARSARRERRHWQPSFDLETLLVGGAATADQQGMPGPAAFDHALRRLEQSSEPAVVMFVDVLQALPAGPIASTWLDQAGSRIRQSLRAGDLVFRLDAALFAVLARCLYDEDVRSLSNRLRWTICGTDLIPPERIVLAAALWTPGMPVEKTLALAWEEKGSAA